MNFSSCCFAVAVRLSLVALACLPVTFPNLDGLRLDVNYKFFVPPCGFNLKRFATTEIDWLKACASHFSNFSLVSCFPAEPIRNKFVFSDSKVRMKMPYVGVKYVSTAIWCCQRFNHSVIREQMFFSACAGICYCEKYKSKILIFWKVGGAKVRIDHVRFKTLLGL